MPRYRRISFANGVTLTISSRAIAVDPTNAAKVALAQARKLAWAVAEDIQQAGKPAGPRQTGSLK